MGGVRQGALEKTCQRVSPSGGQRESLAPDQRYNGAPVRDFGFKGGKTMQVDLVRIEATDGLRLDGAWHAPQGANAGSRADGIVCLHGTGANFYTSTVFQHLTPSWVAAGMQVVWANTRGHDSISTAYLSRGRRRQGAAFEQFQESPHDLVGWAQFLKSRGCERIVYAGHSAGAVKAIYAEAVQPQPEITGLLAISPPRLSYQHFTQSAQKGNFLDAYRRAELLVAAGEGDTLLEVTFPLTATISAAGYLEKYGPREEFNILNLLPRVTRPLLLTYGSIEVGREIAFEHMPQEILRAARAEQDLSVHLIEGADHVYNGRYAELARAIGPWLQARA
jgi:dienelactone hydrolase